MPLTVRAARPEDAPTIVEFNRRLAHETEDVALDLSTLSAGVDRVLADPMLGLYFVGEIDGRVIGQLMITYEWSDWRNGWIWWLQSVYVDAAHRSSGVFRTIFEFAVGEAKRRGDVVGIRLYVERDNAVAQATYRKLGFEEIHFHLMQRMPL